MQVRDLRPERERPPSSVAGRERSADRLEHESILRLQRMAGNQAVARWLSSEAAEGSLQRVATVDPYPPADATAVKDAWAKGSYTDTATSDDIETQAYFRWRASAEKAIAKLRKSKVKTDNTKAVELGTWLSDFEARQRWLLRNTPAPAKAGTAAKPSPGEPKDPGNTPTELNAAAAGNAPTPAFRIVHEYEVTMPDKTTTYSYRDDPIRRPYKYMTNETGIDHMGVRLAQRTDVETLLTLAGVTDVAERKAIKMVSANEAGFEGVNTYDTGFVSVGAIQFTTGQQGDGTIIGLMKTAKAIDPAGYKTYFHDLGLDVGKKGGKDQLVVVDPATGTTHWGADAVQAVMNDKRLTAVFQNAGEGWQNFRVAQLQSAIDQYWLTGKGFTVSVTHTNERGKKVKSALSGTIGDVLKSEAGQVAVFERSVHEGPGNAQKKFKAACQHIADRYHPLSVDELAKFEKWIIPPIADRIDVLNSKDLGQPEPPPVGDFPATDTPASKQSPTLVGAGSPTAVA